MYDEKCVVNVSIMLCQLFVKLTENSKSRTTTVLLTIFQIIYSLIMVRRM
jgi:hypothetical protein